MLNVYTGTDIYGVWASFILRALTDSEYSFNFDYGLDTDKIIEDNTSGENYGVVLLGKPIQENQVESVESALSEINNLPFTMIYHFSNWGETLNVDVSVVDEEVNYVAKMVEEISSGQGFIKFKDEKSESFAIEIAEALQTHHKYNGDQRGKNLMLLADLYRENLIDKEYTNMKDIGDSEEVVLKSLQENMKSYVSRKVEEAFIKVLNSGVIVVSIFAEQYINELGRVIISSLTKNGSKVVVLIGKQTRGDDLYRIRTSEGISAEEVAFKLNRGKGKERAATVFLPKGNQAVYNTIIRTLNDANI